MFKIEGVAEISEILGRWYPEDLAYIESVNLKLSKCGYHSDVEIIALFQLRGNHWPRSQEKFYRVNMFFGEVQGVELKHGGGCSQILGFEINSIRDRGLENINYEVKDYEENKIYFNCRCIKVSYLDEFYFE